MHTEMHINHWNPDNLCAELEWLMQNPQSLHTYSSAFEVAEKLPMSFHSSANFRGWAKRWNLELLSMLVWTASSFIRGPDSSVRKEETVTSVDDIGCHLSL